MDPPADVADDAPVEGRLPPEFETFVTSDKTTRVTGRLRSALRSRRALSALVLRERDPDLRSAVWVARSVLSVKGCLLR